jgi:hypothetical protein
VDLDVKVPEVVVVRNGANPGDSVGCRVTRSDGPSQGSEDRGWTHGSAISLSVSLIILLGSAMAEEDSVVGCGRWGSRTRARRGRLGLSQSE